ncbi:MAG: hypothetical protein ACOX5R_04555 [bacterium]
MALKLDKEAIIEYSTQHKDGIFIVILLLVLIFGGWSLYQQSAQSVEDIVSEATSAAAGPGGAQTTTPEVVSEEVVSDLLEKRSRELYNIERNPFGSPEEQLRTRQLVQQAYDRGVELLNQGQYQQAMNQFDQVIALDVTETRIKYPVLPSEYKKRAQREYAKGNIDAILTSAGNDLAEGRNHMQQGQRDQALAVYRRANDNLNSVVDADPQGEVIGQENLKKILDLQKQVQSEYFNLWKTVLNNDIDQVLSQAQTAVSGTDYVAMSKAVLQVNRVQLELRNTTQTAQLVPQAKVQQINTLNEQLISKLKTGASTLVEQAQQQLADAIANNDLVQSQDAVTALRQALNFDQSPELRSQVTAALEQRAKMVLDQAENFYQAQSGFIQTGSYDQFDTQGRARFVAELAKLGELGGLLNSDLRNQIADLANRLATLRLPPPLADGYDIQIESVSGTSVKLSVTDKDPRTSSRPMTLSLRQGQTDPRTKIKVEQVDTANGFIILSKSGYQNAKLPVPQQ